MIDVLKNVVIVSSAIVAFIGGYFAIRKFYRSFFPLKITSTLELHLIEENKDSFSAKLTNCSTETIYITECYVKETKPIKQALSTHLRKPFIKPMYYHNVWWGVMTLDLMDAPQIKLEAGESVDLKYQLDFTHPVSCFLDDNLRVVIELSSGRVVNSKRIPTPKRWHISYRLAGA
ncbi:hypothetical protein [Parashewanella tropica]|uniref:hypothetical protein n=1 Tax=Parashewanella tropica TaxID=2547970 RepID=UPI001059D498|nr:hypothetical protein [Parashewanella tropica]